MFIIDDASPDSVTKPPEFGRGLVDRDYEKDPPFMFAPPTDIKLIPRTEWDARIEEQEKTESSLEHLFLRSGLTNLNQGSYGYCWAHSTTHAVMLNRLRHNLSPMTLSAFAVAATIKQGRNEGGWCGLSAEFARTRGIPSASSWPQGDANYKKYDSPEVWQNAAQNRITEDWVDLSASHYYYQKLTFDQVATCVFQNNACPVDFSWWGHSVCAVRVVKLAPGEYGLRILNSWANWGEKGFATLTGNRAVPDSALAVRATTLAA